MYDDIEFYVAGNAKEPPADEPVRQYYFVAKCRDLVREFEQIKDAALFFLSRRSAAR